MGTVIRVTLPSATATAAPVRDPYGEVLGLELRARGEELRFHDPATGETLLSYDEEHTARRAAEARVAELEARLEAGR